MSDSDSRASSGLSLEAQIQAAEQAVIDRDTRVRANLQTLKADVRAGASSGLGKLFIGTAGAAGVAGAALVLRRAFGHRGAERSAVAVRGVLQAKRKRRLRLTRLVSLVWPLLPIGVRAQVHPGLSGRLLSAVGMGHVLAAPQRATAPPATVATFDLRQLVGSWYEIARLHDAHRAPCPSDALTTYTPIGPSLLAIEHRSRRAGSSSVRTAHGLLQTSDASGARCRVTFAPRWLQWLPMAWDDVYVLDIDATDRHVLLGTPDRQSLRMLSRTADMDGAEVRRLADVARGQGYDLSRLTAVVHTAAA